MNEGNAIATRYVCKVVFRWAFGYQKSCVFQSYGEKSLCSSPFSLSSAWIMHSSKHKPLSLPFIYFYFFKYSPKVFIEFVTILLLFYVLVFLPQGMWDLGSLMRDRTRNPRIGRWSVNHWTTRSPYLSLLKARFNKLNVQ